MAPSSRTSDLPAQTGTQPQAVATPGGWTSYAEFYLGSGYSAFPQEHRQSPGTFEVSMIRVDQEPHDFMDPEVAETVIALFLDVEPGCSVQWAMDGVQHMRKVEPGQIMVVPADGASQWKVSGRRRILLLNIPNATVRSVLGLSCPSHLRRAFWKVSQDIVTDPMLPILMERLWDCSDSTAEGYSAYLADGMLASIISQMLILAETRIEDDRGIALPQWRLRRVTDYVAEHMEQAITLEDMANAAGLSRRHFARTFREETGLTPHKWLMQQRLMRARGLLEETDKPISDISLACGFCSQSHLTTQMQKTFGLTALKWRQTYRR